MAVYQKNHKWYTKFMWHGINVHRLCIGATSKKQAEDIESQLRYKLQQQENGVIP